MNHDLLTELGEPRRRTRVDRHVFWRYALSLYGAWQVNLALMFGSLALAALVVWRVRGTLGVFLASVFGTVGLYLDPAAVLIVGGTIAAVRYRGKDGTR